MLNAFQVGETVVISFEAKKSGAYYDPITSTNIVIYTPLGATDTASAAMTNDAVGKYSYAWQTAGKSAGTYRARVTATDGAYITITDCAITLN